MPYGLTDIDILRLKKLFANNSKIDKVILYGSRAKGTFKTFSDVDITLLGENLSRTDINLLSLAIDDLLLPYQFDISIFSTLKNEELIDHINRIGVTLYQKNQI